MSYFSRGSHLFGLIIASMLTGWAMGAGGIVYYLLRRDYRICPRCGTNWGVRGEQAIATEVAPAATGPAPASVVIPEVPHSGWSILLFLLAAILAVGAIAETNLAAMGLAAISAGGGLLLHRRTENRREARRAALIASMQPAVLKLAAEHRGRLTVTDVATKLGWTLPRAEKVLQSLEDGYRVSAEVTNEGVIVYEFLELLHTERSLERGQDGQSTVA